MRRRLFSPWGLFVVLFVLFAQPDGHLYSFFKGGTALAPLKADNDYTAVQEGFISVSRVFAQPCGAGGSFDIPNDFFKMP